MPAGSSHHHQFPPPASKQKAPLSRGLKCTDIGYRLSDVQPENVVAVIVAIAMAAISAAVLAVSAMSVPIPSAMLPAFKPVVTAIMPLLPPRTMMPAVLNQFDLGRHAWRVGKYRCCDRRRERREANDDRNDCCANGPDDDFHDVPFPADEATLRLSA